MRTYVASRGVFQLGPYKTARSLQVVIADEILFGSFCSPRFSIYAVQARKLLQQVKDEEAAAAAARAEAIAKVDPFQAELLAPAPERTTESLLAISARLRKENSTRAYFPIYLRHVSVCF